MASLTYGYVYDEFGEGTNDQAMTCGDDALVVNTGIGYVSLLRRHQNGGWSCDPGSGAAPYRRFGGAVAGTQAAAQAAPSCGGPVARRAAEGHARGREGQGRSRTGSPSRCRPLSTGWPCITVWGRAGEPGRLVAPAGPWSVTFTPMPMMRAVGCVIRRCSRRSKSTSGSAIGVPKTGSSTPVCRPTHLPGPFRRENRAKMKLRPRAVPWSKVHT